MRIEEVHVAPGEKTPVHTHARYVAVYVNPARVRFTYPDRTEEELEIGRGTARYSEGVTHSLENIGSTEAFIVDIELKEHKP